MKISRLHDTNSLIDKKKLGEQFKDGEDYTTIYSIIEYPKALGLDNLTIVFPTKVAYEEAIKIAIDLLKNGTPVPAIDILIASIAIEKDIGLITNDKHFNYIKSVKPNLKII